MASSDESKATLALMGVYLKDLRKRKFYGTVELTYQNGEVSYIRENTTSPVAALASDLWRDIPEDFKAELENKFKGNKGFKIK